MTQNNKFIPIEKLSKYIGKYILRDSGDCKWMFKLLGVKNNKTLIVTQGMDVYPKARAYHGRGIKDFNTQWAEDVYSQSKLRLPTKNELNLYRQFSREIILLNTNKSCYGTK